MFPTGNVASRLLALLNHRMDKVKLSLQRLCHRGTERPIVGQWWAWYARFRHLLRQHTAREEKAGA